VLIGDVIVSQNCYVGPNAVLRGDFGRIILQQSSNAQDTCVMHGFPGKDCIVEADGHVGHGAALHVCRIGRNAMIGMNTVIMDYVVIGKDSIVAATAFAEAKFECPPRSLVIGNPGRVKSILTDDDVAWKSSGTRD